MIVARLDAATAKRTRGILYNLQTVKMPTWLLQMRTEIRNTKRVIKARDNRGYNALMMFQDLYLCDKQQRY